MRKHIIGLVQINNSFSGQNYFPYSVGLLQAYAEKNPGCKANCEFLDPIYKRLPVRDAVKRLRKAHIVFFSVYVWNAKISLEVARRLKRINPSVLTVFGGPEIPRSGQAQKMLRKYDFVDMVCRDEGERAFVSILENYPKSDWSRIPSIEYMDKNGKYRRTHPSGKRTDLDEVPSPYLTGVFDKLMADNPKENWIGLWETNRGCPFNCTYCVWGAAAHNKIYTRSREILFKEIEWFAKHKVEFVFCCDANYGILPRDIEFVKHFAAAKKKYGYPKALSVQNTKNSYEGIFNVYKTLSAAKMNKGVALALQSVNPETLKSVKRENIQIDIFKKLQARFNKEGIETFTDIIIGLPRETYSSFADGVSYVIRNGQHNRIQFNNLSVLVNSEMDDAGYQKKHGIVFVETKIVNVHGSLTVKEDIQEKQRIVIETSSMPRRDWAKARVFGWLTSLLYFNKLMQIPFAVLIANYRISCRELVELFMQNSPRYPVLSQIYRFFDGKAKAIQAGDAEYCRSEEYLNMWWPADELVMIRMAAEDQLNDFYDEAKALILEHLGKRSIRDANGAVAEAVDLNRSLVKMPFVHDDISRELNYNIWQVYRAVLTGKHAKLEKKKTRVLVDRTAEKWSGWNEWCREVIWYGNKHGDYLYQLKLEQR